MRHAKRLRMPHIATFLERVSADFSSKFVPRLKEKIRWSWGYATTCNAISQEAGGEAGQQACRGLAARISRLDRRLMKEIEPRAISLLVLSFGRHASSPECRDGTTRIAHFCCDEAQVIQRMDGQSLALLVNGFSKWPEENACRRAMVAIAGNVDAGRLSDFDPQNLANLVNGFSKRPRERACRRATVAIARELIRRPADQLARFDKQQLANLVNGFSKWALEQDCGMATVAIAKEIAARAKRDNWLQGLDPQHLANLVNGFGKWPQEQACSRATVQIATEVSRRASRADELSRRATRADGLSRFTSQHLANLVNGFKKWPERARCGDATAAVAREVLGRAEQLRFFTPQELANLVNGCSKWPQDEDCRRATVAIAEKIVARANSDGTFSGFAAQELSNLVNGFSKWPQDEDCGKAIVEIAKEIAARSKRKGRFSDFAAQTLSNLVNGFSKWPQDENCSEAIVAIAKEIVVRANGDGGFSDFAAQTLSNLANGFSKWPEQALCGDAIAALAREVLGRAEQLPRFTCQELANLANGFSKYQDDETCRQAVLEIARRLGAGAHRFSAFTTSELSMLANALARSSTDREQSGQMAGSALLKDRLHKLAHYLHYANDRLAQADVLGIANLFKALGNARLVDDLALLAPAGLDRLEVLCQRRDFADDNSLEAMGNLCVAVLPLARSSQKQLRWRRRQALNLLNDIQGVIEDKIASHLGASEAGRIHGPHASRCPALSIYQVLKARAVLERLYRRPYVEGNRFDLTRRQQDLQRGTREILHRTRNLIQRDLSNMSWNLIAQIEADGPLEALDSFLAQNATTVEAHRAAARFNMHQVLRDMDHAPRPPHGNAGLMQLPVVDLQGRRIATEPEIRYSAFHRLTEGQVPVVAVQLPAPPSAFMLARTLTVAGVPYRMDLFGGSKLKPPRLTLAQIAARAPGAPRAAPPGGKLLAIPYADTAAGTDFERLSRAWAPFKEAYFYTQRRGFAAPPAIKGLGPHDSALEGAFRLSLLPDRPAGEAHPFRLTGPYGDIALQPHDGCGFIKASLAERMPAVQRAGRADGPERVPAYGEGRRASLPASALQHYPRSEAVADEAREKAMSWLASRDGHELTSEELYRTVTGGHIDGPGAVAVPSSDGRLHVPTLKSETLTGEGGVLIGRSPYDKPNLRPFATAQVRSTIDGDPTASFLDRCVAIQYSFNVAQKSSGELAADDPTFFAKGILIVVPDAMWPAAFADRGLVLSAEDVKCHSHWTRAKDRAKEDTLLEGVGILQATEVFAPGSLVAVPPGEQKKLDGDFDGDAVIIVGDRPQLYQHVLQFDQEEQARGVHSLKPPKSHTAAMEGKRYQFSRASQILAATQNVLEIYTGLQRDFLAQSHEARRWFAERAVFGIYEGIHHELRGELHKLMTQDEVSRQEIEDKLAKARQEIEVADHPVARELAELLMADLEAWSEEHISPGPADSVSDARRTVSEELCELFPGLAETYPATAQARERIQLIVDHYPARIHPRPDGYVADELVQATNNLLSLGIKVGTDAYKSDTGARLFAAKSRRLLHLLQQTPGLNAVPYNKGLAASLQQGWLDIDATLADLKDNPTLTASIMEASIRLAAERGILPKPSDRRLASTDSAMTITLSREEAAGRAKIEADRARIEEEAITTIVGEVVDSLRQHKLMVNLPHHDRRLRSEASMRDQLIGVSLPSGDAAQLINNAVRHVFEIPDSEFTAAFRKAVLAFEEHGYTEVSTTNCFRVLNPTFVGIKTVFATPQGYRFEVEFHTPGSYKAKIVNHDTYKMLQREELRGSEETLDPSRAEQLLQRARAICKDVAIPDQATDIPNWNTEAGSTAGRAAFAVRAARPKRSPMAGQVVAALGEKSVVLVGMMGAGKSDIGKKLSKLLGLTFVDSDKVIEKKVGMKISKIFKDHDEQYFRDLEEKEIPQLLEQGPVVLATGGGSFINEKIRNCIGEKGISIWINADPNMIMRHVAKNANTRPLLQTASPQETIKELMHQREHIYAKADLRIDPTKREVSKNADACLNKLHEKLCNRVSVEPGVPACEELRDDAPSGGALGKQPAPGASSTREVQQSWPAPRAFAQPRSLKPVGPSSAALSANESSRELPRSVNGRSGLVLGAREWLGSEHIAADYALLEQELQRNDPDLAARTRFVRPAVAALLRLTENRDDQLETFLGIVNDQDGNDTADFLFLPVNDGDGQFGGSHWSLLLVDRHTPGGAVAHHYDSSAGAHNHSVATELAARLGARLESAGMAEQQNGYDCGVFVLDGTRALVRGLAQSPPAMLHLDNIVADRQALQYRLRAHPG
ncbi:shikimate kinase [Bradyrhizobium sp. CB82]|uniref:shikimate kinase n=1 Tax=Bradyrhizobium sp. CB82 TaxID=3039159 RepID=UPI0024B0A9F9|nr:shikimate kinase [Bradyrhizobium sp. CB82]WFU40169.1 shikimate kinase [Bradyrhizobium sp. CB82]